MAELRLADILGALSLATDLVNGQPPEMALRCTLLATRLARARGEPEATLRDVYWSGVLRFTGCSGFAVEEAPLAAGNDNGLREVFMRTDLGKPSHMIGAVIRDLGKGAPLVERARSVARFLSSPSLPLQHAWAQCDAARYFARKMGMSGNVVAALGQIDERFDGKGLPNGLRGEEIALPQRYVELARVVMSQLSLSGVAGAVAEVRRRTGGAVDPVLASEFCREPETFCESLTNSSVWELYLACEPGEQRVGADQLSLLFEAFARFADLKSAYTLEHSTGVSYLADQAAQHMGLAAAERTLIRHAALLHDLGRVSVATGIWDKSGGLNTAEWERVRLHPYYTDRVLRRSPELSRLAAVAGRAHERLDGTGYYRGDGAAAIDRAARLLAAADQFFACTESRAYRPAHPLDEARRLLRTAVNSGLQCRQACDAVLSVSGERAALGGPLPSIELSERETEVIGLLAIGLSNKEIGKRLGISPRTVQHHSIHIYEKIGVKSRAGAALYAAENGLLRSAGTARHH